MNITQICKLLFHFGLRGASVEICDGAHKEPLAGAFLQLRRIQFVVVFGDQVKDITENDSVGRCNQLVADISGLCHDVNETVPVVKVHDLVQSVLENLEIFMPDFIRELSGLKIFASQKHVGVSQPGTLETNANGHANQMRRFNCQKCVVRGVGGWYSGCCCKRIDLIAGFILVNGDKSLNEVVLRQTLSARIDSDENICDIFFVCRVTDFQSR